MDPAVLYNGLLEWLVRLAGLFWLIGAFALFRQIRVEAALDRMTSQLETMAKDLERDALASGDLEAPVSKPKDPAQQWMDRDDAARRGWIAAQAVVLAATALAMILLHPFAAWMVALPVLGQGVYFFWRETVARHAPGPEAAAHARPTKATINAGWVSLFVACLVWAAAFRGLLR